MHRRRVTVGDEQPVQQSSNPLKVRANNFLDWLLTRKQKFLQILPVPESANIEKTGPFELQQHVAQQLANRSALVYFVGLGVAILWSASVTWHGPHDADAATIMFGHQLFGRCINAVYNVIIAAWYPTNLEIFYSTPVMKFVMWSLFATSVLWVHGEVTTFPMPNAACAMAHQVTGALVLLDYFAGIILMSRQSYTWGMSRTLEIVDGILCLCGLLAMRWLGPPRTYPPGVSFHVGLFIHVVIQPLTALVLTPATRFKVAAAWQRSGLHHVPIELNLLRTCAPRADIIGKHGEFSPCLYTNVQAASEAVDSVSESCTSEGPQSHHTAKLT